METKKIMTDMGEVELLEYVPDFYIGICDKANEILPILRKAIPNWTSADVCKKMNISLWVYNSTLTNAFAQKCDDANYIALSVGLLQSFWNAANEFVYHENFHKVIKLADENKPGFIDNIFLSMVIFIVAHEFGHIAHGHLLYNNSGNFVTEYMSSRRKLTPEENLREQMKEFDADNVAADISFALNIYGALEKNDTRYLKSHIDALYIATYLVFRTLAEKKKRDYDSYFEKDIDSYDHPYPGLRMFYTNIFYAAWIIDNNLDVGLIQSGTHVVMAYEKQVLDKKEYKEGFYAIGQTKRGTDHVKLIMNGWRSMVSKYNRHAYIHIQRKEFIDTLPYSLTEDGDFIPIK